MLLCSCVSADTDAEIAFSCKLMCHLFQLGFCLDTTVLRKYIITSTHAFFLVSVIDNVRQSPYVCTSTFCPVQYCVLALRETGDI